MPFTVRGSVSSEAETAARARYAENIDSRIADLVQRVFNEEVALVLRDFAYQADAILTAQELEALDAVASGKARAPQYRSALAALQKIKAAA